MNLIFECQVITPMFIYGSDGTTPELRPPAIKAVLRFWFRVINAQLETKALLHQESLLFGGTGEYEENNVKKKYGKSPLNINIISNNLNTGEKKSVPHKSFSIDSFVSGTFEIKFSCKDETKMQIYKNLFILSTILGGFGRRTRRGMGCIKVTKIGGEDFNENFNLEYIKDLLNSISDIYEINNYTLDKITLNVSTPTTTYENKPYIKEIEFGKSDTNIDKLLLKISNLTHKAKPKNNSNILGFASGNRRFSSPIMVSIIKSSDLYIPIIVSLNPIFNGRELNSNDDRTKADFFKNGIKT